MPDPLQAQVNPGIIAGGSLPMTASPDALGAGVGSAIQGMGDEANRQHREDEADYQRHLMQFNRSMVLDASNKLADFNQAALYDPKTGVLNQNTGKDAPAAVDKTMEAYDKHVADVAGTLTSEQQRLAFRRMADNNRHQIQQHLDGYEVKQIDTYHQQVTAATLKNAAAGAVQNVNAAMSDPDPRLATPEARARTIDAAATNSLELGVAAIHDEAERQNLPPETVADQVATYTSSTHYGVLQSMLSQGQDQDAKAYYDAHKSQLRGAEADNAAHQIEIGSTAGEAVRTAPKIVFDDQGNVRTRAQIYSDIQNNKRIQSDPKLLDATLGQVDRILSHHDAAVNQTQNDAMTNGYNTLQANGGDWATVPPSLQTQMRPEQWESLKNFARKAVKGEPVRTDPMTWSTLDDMASDKTKAQAFAKVNLLNYVDRLSLEDFKSFKEKQQKAANGADDMMTRDGEINEIAKSSMLLNKMDPNAKPGTQAAIDNVQYLRAVKSQVTANEKLTGKPMNREQVQKLSDELLIQTKTGKKGWLGGDIMAPAYQIPEALRDSERLGSAVTEADSTAWSKTLANPHADNFDESVSRLQRWSAGIDSDGQYNPALAQRYQSIIVQQISAQQRQDITAALKLAGTANPSESQILATWASHKKRTVPRGLATEVRQAAPMTTTPSPGPGWEEPGGGDWTPTGAY